MINCILTGGIACGKSAVLAGLAEQQGVVVFSADEAVRLAYQDPAVCELLRAAVGLGGQGLISAEERRTLRARVVAEPETKAALEAVLHPIAFSARLAAAEKALAGGAQVFVAEVPLYYETGAVLSPDLVIVVAASRVSQLSRLCVDRGLDRETAEALLSIQLPVKDKAERADILLWNDGSRLLLQMQVAVLTCYLKNRTHDRHF